MSKPSTVNDFVASDGVAYVAVDSPQQEHKYQNSGCIGCAFHDPNDPYKIIPGCTEAPACDGNDRLDGRNIHWEVKKDGGKKLYKTTIVILSEYDPSCEVGEITDLARDAMMGDAYLHTTETVEINCTDLDGEGVKEFFNCPEEEEHEHP